MVTGRQDTRFCHLLVKVWDATSGQLLNTLSMGEANTLSVAWSPDGKTLAAGGDDGTVHLWDAQSGQLLRTLIEPIGNIYALAWSPDSKLLASTDDEAGARNKTRVWNMQNGQLLLTFISRFTLSLSWSPDGKTLASTEDVPPSIRLWDVSAFDR
jgi:WD40 repeat protein